MGGNSVRLLPTSSSPAMVILKHYGVLVGETRWIKYELTGDRDYQED